MIMQPIPTKQVYSPSSAPVDVTLRFLDSLALGMVLDGVVLLVERLANFKSIAYQWSVYLTILVQLS